MSLLKATKAVTDVEKGNRNHSFRSSAREKEMQIVTTSAFKLPDGWLIEERPRVSNPSHVDRWYTEYWCLAHDEYRHIYSRYYYEPKTRRQFRSLQAVQRHLQEEAAVQRYLQEEARDYHTTGRIISENKDTNYTESGTGQRFHSVIAYERCLTGENASTSTPKLVLKFVTGKQSAHGGVPKKADSQKKVNFGDEETVHNLTRPPEKVRWVLSGPGGHWRPFLDNSMAPESERLKWSEAFVQSIHEGYGQ